MGQINYNNNIRISSNMNQDNLMHKYAESIMHLITTKAGLREEFNLSVNTAFNEG